MVRFILLMLLAISLPGCSASCTTDKPRPQEAPAEKLAREVEHEREKLQKERHR